jgi:hypothetical protein
MITDYKGHNLACSSAKSSPEPIFCRFKALVHKYFPHSGLLFGRIFAQLLPLKVVERVGKEPVFGISLRKSRFMHQSLLFGVKKLSAVGNILNSSGNT